MPINSKVKRLYDALKADGGDVGTPEEFNSWFFKPGKEGYKNRKSVYDTFKADGADVGKNYEEFGKWLGLHAVYPTVNKYHQQMLNSVDPNKSRASELTHRAVSQAKRGMNNVRKPVVAKVVNREGKPTGKEFAITPAKTVEDLDREYAQETTKNWENELHDQMADADKDAAKISDMFKSFIGSTDEVGSVWGNMTRGGGIAGTPHSVTTNNGILENTEARQILAAGDYNRKRKELLRLEKDSRNGAIFDNHSFFRGMYDAAKDTGFLTGGASNIINAGSLLATRQDLDNGVHTEAGDMLMQQAVKNSNAQSQYGDNKGWMYTGGVITTNMAPFIVQIASAGFSKGLSTSIGKVVQGAASKVALGTMKKAAGFASADLAKNIGKVTGLTTKAFGKAIQYGIVGAAQANTVGLGNVANDVINRYTGQVYQDEQGNYKFGTFDSDGKLVHEGGEDFLTAFVKGDAAQTIEFATELAGGGIDAVGTALKNFVIKGGKKIINKYNMENVSKVIDFLLNNKVSKNVRYLKAGADRTLGKVEVNSIVGESLEEELGIIANTVFTGDNKISDLWDEKQQSQIWGGMLLSIGLMKGAVAPFHAYNAKQYYSYKHKLNKADVNLSQLLGKEKWEELRNQIDATTNEDMPEMVNKINRDVALGKNRQPVREYIQNLLIMRGYDIGNMLAAKKAVEDKGEGVSVKNMEKNQAYQQGRDAYGYDTHEIQLDQEDKQKSLAQLIGISEQQLASMSDEELESFSGRDDNIDRAIYDYQLSSARYEGVVDNARDQIDLEVQRAAQAVDMYTDKSRNTIRNATIKASGGAEDYGVYIISGNIATHDDGSIDVSNSDDMILYYDPTTNTVEHADAMMFAELGSEENADEVRSQAMADAKEKAIKETTGIIDGVVEVGTQFKTIDADGTEHTYEVLADNGDGTAMITIDGNIPTELVKGENVNIPVSFEELQNMKDEADQQRLQAAKAQREQMEKERAEQQMQSQTTQAENPAHEDNIQSAPIKDNIKYSDIIREDGKVQMVNVSDKYGNNLFPDAKDVFYIQGNKMRTKFAYIDANGKLKTQNFPTGLVKIKTRGKVSVDDYKKYRNTILAAESSFIPESSKIEDNSGENRGEIEEEAPTIEGETAGSAEETATSESSEATTTEQTPAITLEDGTIVPMLEDGNPDFSKLSAAQTAELYDTQFDEDADGIVSGYVSDAKKALDKANNMTVKGKTFVEQKAAKAAKEKAIADAQAAYDSAIAIRDAYNERQLAKEENTTEGRKSLIEKAKRKFARLKNSEEWSERPGDLWNETVGKLLHRLYDATGIDVFNDTPNTVYEYVAENVGPYSLNYEGNDNSKGVQQETGLSRSDFAKLGWLAAEGKGMTIDAKVHRLWENRPSNLESAETQEIRNALISLITSGQTAFQARDYILNQRIELAESALEEQLRQEEDAAEAQRVKEEEEKKKAELEKKAEEEKKKTEENEKINDNINAPEQNKFPDKLKDGSETIEVPEDATDENPLGLQLSEDKVPFEIEGGKSGETYNINDDEDRQRLINDNKVDDKDILDIDMPKHVHKAIKELCKKMGLKVQFLYMGARSNGWIENGNMYLALDTEKATQFVFGHEMTHAIKQKNSEAYKELVKVAMAVTTRKKFEEDLAKVYQNYHGISGYNNVDDYVEEVVADNLGKFINDFDLAQKFSLRLNHPVLATILHAIQKIKSLLYGDFYKSVDALERIVEKAYVDTANGQVTNSETGEDVSFSLRQKPEPKKKGVGYKVFVLKDGKLYPPMVANPDGAATPVGVWLDADAAPIAGESKTGRPQVKQGGKGTQGGSGKLAYRPGWHLGVVPYAIQFNRKDAEGNKTLFPKNFVFAEVEYAADVDYQEEARQEGINPSGKYQHSLAGLKHLPTDGYYMYRTNPNPETDPWVITGAMKVNRILTRAEQAELVKNAGREPQQIQEGDIVTDDVVNSINQEIADAPKFSLKVYHGSGADFTEFDFNHMGEGAGSQVFGWGGYVTSSKKIGKSYAKIGQMSAEDRHRHASSEDTPIEAAVGSILGQEIYNERAKTFEQKKAQAIENAENSIASYSDMLKNSNELDEKSKKFLEKSIERYKKELEVLRALTEEQYKEEYIKQGRAKNLYEVDIPDDNGSNYLDWENPLNEEQINAIRDALAKNGVDVSSWENRGFKLDLPFKDVYAAVLPMMMRCEPKEVSKFLSSLGFTGIKYPAGTIQGGAEEGDTNYVIFKPEDMKITQHTKFSLRLKAAIEETETNPSDAQKESGNYKKGHIKFGGYDYTIENPKGSTRSGKDADGKEWKITMHDTYGYIRGKFGKDGDHLDMFINDKADLDNWNGDVFVVDQVNPDGSFDEHKVMYGYDSMDDAKKAYLANYSDGWQGLGNITGVSKDEFDKWLDASNRKLKPFADYAKVKFSLKDNQGNPLNQDGTLKLDKIKSVDELTDEDFLHPTRNVELPSLPKKIADAIGTEGKPVVIKKNIFERNYMRHKDVTPELSKVIFKSALYNPDLYGQNQKKTRPYNWVLINTKDEKGNNRTVLLEVNPNKDNVEIVHWHFVNDKNLGLIKKQAIREGDQVLILPSEQSEEVGGLSNLTDDLSAAKIDNSSETAKENGEKFSLKDEKTLAGVHNITEEKLLKAIKQGGLANPSVAVIDSSKQNHEDYGDISLILPSDKVAKRTGKNAGTWQGDAWTPTYPQVERQMSNKGAEKASNDVSSVPSDMYSEVRRGLDRWLDGGEGNSAMAYMFLHEKGVAPEPKKIQPKFSDEAYNELKFITDGNFNIYGIGKADAQKVLDMYIEAKFDGDKDLYEEKTKAWLERNKSIVDAGAGGMRYTIAKENVELYDEYGFNYKGVQTFVRDVEYDHRKTGVDMNATLNEVEDYIKANNLTDEFNTWLEGKEKEYGIKEVIFDGFTPSGNRRYVPNTLENVSKIMKKQGRNGATGTSVSFQNFAARLMPSYGTLKDIRSKKGLLTSDHEDLDKFNEKWANVFFELGMKCQPDATGTFDDYGLARLSEAAMTSDPQAYLKKEYNVDFSDEDTKRLKEMVKAIKEEYPAMYFETKFERPVGFDEFSSAVVPTTASNEVKQALQNAGVQIYEYDKEKEGDRSRAFNEAINSSDNIRFSLKTMMEKPEGWKQANKKAIHIAEAIERDPKFSLKNLDGTLIKAGTYFSGGGLVEEGLKGIIDPVVAVEYDEKISGVYRNNFGQHIVTADVRDVDPKELVKQIDGEVEYFHASPVCKNYSQAKSNHAELELDKETAASTAEFINAIKPKVVTIENVKGYKDSDAMKTITDALDANGYTWDADVYNAADYGGYTNRERLIVRAVRDGKLPEKPKKMAHKSGWYEAVEDIIPTLTEKKNGVAPWMDIRLKADGIDWRNIDKPLYVMGSAYADGKVPHAFADELLPTLRTKSGDVIVMPDGKVYRAMGRVLARVSGVSDDYKMPFSENLSHTIIGNGIPTQLTEHVIAPLLTGSDPKFSIRTYHGTGAKFDKFDFSHMGEGEGSQAFGWGGYVTNSKDIAEDYTRRAKIRKDNGGFEFVTDMSANNKDMVRQYIYKHKDVNKGLDAMRKDLSSALEMFPDDDDLKELSNILAKKNEEIAVPDNIAYLYDVDIPDDNGDYLDWDAPLTDKQKNTIIKELRRLKIDFADFKKRGFSFDGSFGGNAYDFLMYALRRTKKWKDVDASRAVSKFLSSIGFTGIKYKAGSIFGGAKEGDYNYVIFDEDNANIVGNTKFSLRGSTPYDKQMEEWMEKNHLEKGAVPMEKPVMKEGENIFDYANRMVEWTRNQNLWKTAPKQTGFQDALDKWKADNGLSPDAYPPVRPHRENYSTEIGYTEDLEEYNKKKELWKSAPKPKDFDLSVDLEDMNKQLRNIRRAVLNQKNYDQRTIKAVSDLVRKMLNIGWGDGLSRGKVGNLLSAAKNATGANDVKKYLDKAMGILAENYLNRLSTAYDNLINTKGARADQSGVIKMGSLDANGQAFMSEYKKAINMDDKSLNNYVANIEEDSAKNEDNVEMNDSRLAGIQAAIMYKQQIGGNDADIAELQRQIGELKNKKDATKEDKDLLKSLEKKLFENKFDRITMYENLLNNIQRMVKESKGRAKEFREEIAEHKNEILHLANLDLEGVDSTYYDTTNAKKKLVNNDLQRAVFSSTYTFEQFLKFFGKKAANGEGRLYNYFTKLNQDALDEEQLYKEMNRNALDEKTKELFGKKKFMNLVGIDGNGMKEMDIEVTDYSNKKTGKRTIHLKQGQMLYIYLVNKETDGEMKLRAMGITEEDVAAIEENLDPRVKAMGEWLQDEYLPECQRRYQATHTKYFGAPMKEVENYFPLAINNRARNVKEDVNQDSDAMSQLAGTSTGAIVTRRVNVIPLDIENADAFEVAFNHLQEMEEWSAMLPFRQDINTLLSYTHFRNQVQNMSSVAYGSGKTLWDEFKQTAQIAAGTYKPKVNAGMMDSRIAAAMGGIAVAKISGRLWTAIKQSQSATVFLPECDFTRFVKNGVNPYGSWKWAMENIPDFRKRVENMTYGDVKLRQYLDELEKWHDWTKTISKIGMAPNILVDGITCAVGARSVYETEVNRLTKLGYPKEKAEEKAYYKAVAAYNKTQQSSGGMYLSPMQVDRTYVSAALSLFKNANYAYGRMQIEACRGLARTYDFWGGKHKTTLIESMTRQIMEEDGLDENTARAIAKATYNRTFRQSIGRLINFATLVPVSWALYKVLPYLLIGDDDDKKNDMIEEAVLKGFATSLSDNYVIPFASNILNAGLKVEDGKPTFDPGVFRYQNLYINPATSDLANIYSMVGNQKWYSVANKLGMLGVQSLIGFNPETVGALYQAFAEADYDNGNTTKEWQIGILKAISAPEESIRELYMDELGLKSGDIKKIPLAELEKRYAERQINRDNLLSQIGMDAETFNGYVDKYQKSFENKIKDKMDKWDEYDKKKTDEFFDTTSDPKLKDMIEKKRAKDANAAADEQIAKEGLNQEKKGKEPSEEAYDAVKMSIDVAEDNAISTYNKVLNKRYAALNDEYNEQTDAMKYIFMSKHPNFKAYKDLKSEYTTYGKKIKKLKEKLVSADGYDAKQTILKQIRAEREKFSKLQSKVR
jgi:site-specific DNA-cytosine methylase